MTFEIQIRESNLRDLDYLVTNSDLMRMNAAMANRCATIIHHNFGMSGEDRPFLWPSLTIGYAKWAHGGNTTPTLQLTGELQSSIQIDENNPDFARVYTDNEYAAEHQWGDGPLPARPFFPMYEDGTLTTYTESDCVRAAHDELERILAGK